MKKVLILVVLVSLNLVTLSCSNDDSSEMKESNAELQAFDKDRIERPQDRN